MTAVVAGRLIIAGTPIGNPGDASTRLRQALAEAPVVAAEDTRRLRRLAADLGVQPAGEIVSYYDAVERIRTPALLRRLRQGQDVLLVSDAGMPAVSDPGHHLVAACADAGIEVTCLPGPSAVLAALTVSGLAGDRFCFEGFPPRKAGALRTWLAGLVDEQRTTVFFESPRRVGATLAAAAQVLGGDRPAAVCRELTKTHEQVLRGGLAQLAEQTAQGVLGEVVVVIGPALAPPGPIGGPADWAAAVAAAIAAGEERKQALLDVARRHGVTRREVYDAVTRLRRPGGPSTEPEPGTASAPVTTAAAAPAGLLPPRP